MTNTTTTTTTTSSLPFLLCLSLWLPKIPRPLTSSLLFFFFFFSSPSHTRRDDLFFFSSTSSSSQATGDDKRHSLLQPAAKHWCPDHIPDIAAHVPIVVKGKRIKKTLLSLLGPSIPIGLFRRLSADGATTVPLSRDIRTHLTHVAAEPAFSSHDTAHSSGIHPA
jgi:hypothetical protein